MLKCKNPVIRYHCPNTATHLDTGCMLIPRVERIRLSSNTKQTFYTLQQVTSWKVWHLFTHWSLSGGNLAKWMRKMRFLKPQQFLRPCDWVDIRWARSGDFSGFVCGFVFTSVGTVCVCWCDSVHTRTVGECGHSGSSHPLLNNSHGNARSNGA